MTAPNSTDKTQTPLGRSRGGWSPETKAQSQMAPFYRGMSPEKRMAAAIKLVLDSEDKPAHQKVSQAEAARQCGVTRPKLNQRIKEIRSKLDDQQARSKVAQQERLAGPLDDQVRRFPTFREFDEMYFSGLVCTDCGEHHELASFHEEIMDKVSDPEIKRLLINIPPFHAKSVTATVKSTIYELSKDPNSQHLLVTATEPLAKKFLRSIKKYLEDDRIYESTPRNLIEDWGPFHPGTRDGWSATQIYIAKRQTAEKDPSVEAKGYGGNIYGSRFNRIVFDDIADFKNQRNPENVQEMFDWIQQEPATRIGGKTGKMVFVGTRVRANDVYSMLYGLPGYEVIRYPCILDEESQATLWPEHYDWASAERQRSSMAPDKWQLVFQNIDTPGVNASFPPEILAASHDPKRIIGHTDPDWALVAGLDPGGAGAQAGYTAMVLMGVDTKTNMRYLVDVVNVRSMKAPQVRDQIFDWADRYPRLRELRVEVNGLQGQIYQYNDELNAHLVNKGIRLAPHITHGNNKWDADFGVESCAPLYYNHMISTPWGDLASRNKFQELENQLMSFPMGMPNDLAMAFWICELGCREIFQRETMPLFQSRLKVPNRIAKKRRVIDWSDRTLRRPTEQDLGTSNFPEEELRPLANMGGSVRMF